MKYYTRQRVKVSEIIDRFMQRGPEEDDLATFLSQFEFYEWVEEPSAERKYWKDGLWKKSLLRIFGFIPWAVIGVLLAIISIGLVIIFGAHFTYGIKWKAKLTKWWWRCIDGTV